MTGLPRARGDRPHVDRAYHGRLRASPRTRGSTQSLQSLIEQFRGFPAHAGIDPKDFPLAQRIAGLPRARGDRPGDLIFEGDNMMASPRTRGSTRRQPDRRQPDRGFPAHAGIDPIRPSRASSLGRLPRARGDRPPGSASSFARKAASPRTRGSTHPSARAVRACKGFPAHAGIDPSERACCEGLQRLPRARGDRPS